MKKLISLALLSLFLVSFVLAINSEVTLEANSQSGNKKDSSSEIPPMPPGLRAEANIRLRTNIKINENLNVTPAVLRNAVNTRIRLSNGRNAEIKIMPEVASETALARLRLRVCNETRNCSIELKEVGRGEGNQTRLAYEIQSERHFRILGMFRTKAQVRAQVDAENGEILQVKKPWWAFLASEPDETEDSEEN
jgi:hypothetical protein